MVEHGLRLTRVHELLSRRLGGAVPYQPLVRCLREELGVPGRKRTALRVADCAPRAEVQVNFGLMECRFTWTVFRLSSRRRP